MTQLSDLRTAIYRQANISTSDTSLTSAVLTGLINEALKAIATDHDWPWLYSEDTISAVVGTRDYSFPTGATRIAWLSIGDGPVFDVRQMKELERWNSTDITGQPHIFSTVGVTSVRIAPYPDTAYTINVGFYQDENTLSGDTDTPLLPSAYDGLVIGRTIKLIGYRLGNNTLVQMGDDLYREWLRRTRDNVVSSA